MSTSRPIPTPFSSNVESLSWDSQGSIMYVTYKSGKTYAYKGVPYQRAVAASKARSVGTYINKNIKGRYPVQQVG
jgi:hypothetical protein